MTKVTYEPEEYHLRVEGHAGAIQENGEDLVCAAASALAWALINAATEHNEYWPKIHIDREKAVIDVRCSPEQTVRKACRYMFDIIAGGLALMADKHPENIRIGGNHGN